MRIIGGKYRSRVLADFKGEEVRPTADRVKESLFNILSLKIYGARVLDLFCGSGALGLEALSRGAKEVVFNDCAKDSLQILKKNLQALKVDTGANGEARIFNYDYVVLLDLGAAMKGGFDLVFIDPPYRFEYGKVTLQKIADNRLLREGGIAVYERDRAFEGKIRGLRLFDERKYGKTYLSFFRAESEEKEEKE